MSMHDQKKKKIEFFSLLMIGILSYMYIGSSEIIIAQFFFFECEVEL